MYICQKIIILTSIIRKMNKQQCSNIYIVLVFHAQKLKLKIKVSHKLLIF